MLLSSEPSGPRLRAVAEMPKTPTTAPKNIPAMAIQNANGSPVHAAINAPMTAWVWRSNP